MKLRWLALVLFCVTPLLALDGDPALHDPSTVIESGGRFYAYVNQCIHAGTPLDWWPNEFFTDDGRLLICATHGALYEPETGRCAGGPCSGGSLYGLPVRVEDDRVVVSGGDDEEPGGTP